MLSILPLWISLNTYALLLDAMAMAGGAGAWMLFTSGHQIWGWTAVIIAAILLFSAIRVHLSYPQKLKAYRLLYKRNHDTFHRSSFHEFMGTPCHRMMVRVVLSRIGHKEEYDIIFKDVWGTGLPCCSLKPATVIIFQNAEEGARWLKSQKHSFSEQDDSPSTTAEQNK